MRGLKERLEAQLKGSLTIDTVEEIRDAEGYLVLRCSDGGNLAAGQPVIWIQVRQPDLGALDVFQQAHRAYTPHECVLAYELTAADNPVPANKDLAIVLWELAKLGIATKVKELASGTAVTEANVDAAAVAFKLLGTGT
ncbi:MAG: hypothetical protein QW594_03855 [Candidatus Woesearchaeota archaeon]